MHLLNTVSISAVHTQRYVHTRIVYLALRDQKGHHVFTIASRFFMIKILETL